MPTARPQTQMITSDSTPRLNTSCTNSRTRAGGVTSARAICAAKTAILPK